MFQEGVLHKLGCIRTSSSNQAIQSHQFVFEDFQPSTAAPLEVEDFVAVTWQSQFEMLAWNMKDDEGDFM